MTKEYSDGFDAGYEFSLKNYDPETGCMNQTYPESFQHRVGAYNCGFGEGLISGRGKLISDRFPGMRSIHWVNEKAVVTY